MKPIRVLLRILGKSKSQGNMLQIYALLMTKRDVNMAAEYWQITFREVKANKKARNKHEAKSSHLDRTYPASDGVMDLLSSQENYFWQGKSLTGKRGSMKITTQDLLNLSRVRKQPCKVI